VKRLFIILFLFGCSSSPYKEGTDPYKTALNDAFNEMEEKNEGRGRSIASIEPPEDFIKKVIGFKSSDLKSFRMLVFPANISFNKKREINDLEEIEYGAPTIFNFKTVLSGKCNFLKKVRRFNSKAFFGNNKFSAEKNCFVIEGRRARPKKWGKMVNRLNRDNNLAIRIYIDEDFRPFGKSIDYALLKGRKNFRTVNLKMDSQVSLSSELGRFPIDLPNLKDPIIGNSVVKGALRLPKDFFVISQVKKRVKRPICKSGYQIDFKDFLGNLVMVDFCKGNSWPFAIHTNNFFAILI